MPYQVSLPCGVPLDSLVVQPTAASPTHESHHWRQTRYRTQCSDSSPEQAAGNSMRACQVSRRTRGQLRFQ
jgi:hypothetical protein